MLSRIGMYSLVLILAFSMVACGAKPSKKEFHDIVIQDIQNYHNGINHRGIPMIGDRFEYWGVNYDKSSKYISFYVLGDIEVNDDDMFPYKGVAYYLTGQTKENPQIVADQLYKMNPDELYNKCKSTKEINMFGIDFRVDRRLSWNYKWGKKSKTWQKIKD